MKKTNAFKSIRKITEKTSRFSLTIVLSLFVFGIILSALMLNSVGLWIMAKTHVIADASGDLPLTHVILLMSAISLIIGGVIAFFSSRIPLKPVNDYINKMNRLAAGDFTTRIELKESSVVHPAVKELADSFNTLAEELEQTELLRSDFINNLSHEFRTPIVSIMGFAGLLEVGDLTEEQRQQYAQVIREEAGRLSSMANNVLNLTKVENQTILTDVTRFNLSEQLRSSVLLLEEKWTAKDIRLQLEFDEQDIYANEEMLKQVWINLVDNAVKFADTSGTVSFEIADEGETVCVRISNTGSEIPEEKLDKIFKKFYQADESRATGGNGIGLAIVKRIVELHNGSVDVTSSDAMTTFAVTLPKTQ